MEGRLTKFDEGKIEAIIDFIYRVMDGDDDSALIYAAMTVGAMAASVTEKSNEASTKRVLDSINETVSDICVLFKAEDVEDIINGVSSPVRDSLIKILAS